MKDKEKQYISMKEMLTKRSFEPITNCNCKVESRIDCAVRDKEKQIEEMQKIMEHCCNVYDDKGRHIRNKCNTFDCEYYCDTNNVCCSFSKKEATTLYDAGYRKIPENARVFIPDGQMVLMTREEFNENYVLFEKRQQEKRIAQASKETAEKILKEVLGLFPKDKQFTTISKATIYELALKNSIEIKD